MAQLSALGAPATRPLPEQTELQFNGGLRGK
jgi:hypothetical protein